MCDFGNCHSYIIHYESITVKILINLSENKYFRQRA